MVFTMLKKITAGNSAAKITASSIISINPDSLISYTTEDAHNLFEGSRVTVVGLTGTSTHDPNVKNGIVFRVPNAKTLIVKPSIEFTDSGAITVNASGTIYAVNGQLGNTLIQYAPEFIIASPASYNFVTPTLSVTASGGTVTLSLGANGTANPSVSNYTITRLFNNVTSTTYTSASAITSTTDTPTGGNLGDSVTYTYKVTNSVGVNSTSASVALQYISQVTGVTASPTPNVENSISLTWDSPASNVPIYSYTIYRRVGTGSYTSYQTGITTKSYVDTNVSPATDYSYQVQAVNGALVSTVSTATVNVQPYYSNSPASVTVSPVAGTENSLSISWDAVTQNPGVVFYYIQRSNDSGTTWTDLSGKVNAYTSVSSSVTSTTNSGLISGNYYAYRVAAFNGQLTSAYTTSIGVQAYYIKPGYTGISYVSTSSTALIINASYFSSNPNINSWKVERSLNGNTWSTLSSSASLPYTDYSTAQNTLYYYRVTPITAQFTSAIPAVSASNTTYSVPGLVQNLVITTPSSTSVQFTWSAATVTDASTPVSLYTIIRATNAEFTDNLTGVYQSSNTSVFTYTDTTVLSNTQYYYRVYASNGIGSGPSNTNSVRTP